MITREDAGTRRTCRTCGAWAEWRDDEWRCVDPPHAGRVSFACRCGRPWGEAPEECAAKAALPKAPVPGGAQ